MLRFGTDGVRGVALTELTPASVATLGAAAAQILGHGTWLIARDTRASGPVLEAALSAGLRSKGAIVVACGVMPTPALAWLSVARGCPAAMITASHNPWQDNGVKIFAAGGAKLRDDVEREIEAQLDAAGAVEFIDDDRTHEVGADGSLIDAYVDHLTAMFDPDALREMRIVIDCANGAMSRAAPLAVRALGAEVVVLAAAPDGTNINAECGATHPHALALEVVARGADLGLAFDGDGDRVIAVDNRGNIVDGDRLIALGAIQLKHAGALTGGAVVVTVMSNLGFHRAMHREGIDVVATAVGDRYVLEALDAGGYAIGGEQSGHLIYRHVATTGDGLLAGLRLADHVRRSGRPLSDLAAEVMTTYPQTLVNIRVAVQHPDIAAELAAEIAAAESQLGGDGRVLVRASGTEPLVRVMVEASTDDVALEIAEGLAEIVRRRFA